MMGTGAQLSGRAHRRLHAEDGAGRRARPRRVRLHHRLRSRKWPTPASATPSPRTAARPPQALPGFKPAQPVVFCGLFPVDAADFEDLRAAMGKLRLNDASFSFEMETSAALGFGFRCGFLGLLHLEIIQERLEREFDLDLIATAPSVVYRMHLTDGTVKELHNPADMPDVVKIDRDRGAVDPRHHPDARRLSRRHPEALPGPARRPGRPLLCRQARHAGLRPAAQRGGVRFLRPAEVDLQGLRLLRLPPHRLPRGRPGQDVDPGQRRAGRRALHAGPPHRGRKARPRHVREAQGADPAAHVQDPDPGGDRRHASSPARRSRRCART